MTNYLIKYIKNGYHRCVSETKEEIGFFISKKVDPQPVFDVGSRYDIEGLWLPADRDTYYYTARSEYKPAKPNKNPYKAALLKRDAKRVDAAVTQCKYGYGECRQCEMNCEKQEKLF